MKTTILKFLAFLEPKKMRVALHIYIGLSFGFNLLLKTGVVDFTDIGEKVIGAFFFSAICAFALSVIYEFIQFCMGAEFSYKDILQSTIASVIGGFLSQLVPYPLLGDILMYSAIALFVLEVIRVLIQKLWK
jgi:hypothetical protein